MAPAKRLGALALACILVVAACGAAVAGYRTRIEEQPFMGYPSADEVTNFDAMLGSYRARVEDGLGTIPVFGSSELNPGPAGPAHPASLLEGGRYGVDVMVMGRAFCEDLWQAVEVGAFADELAQKRVVLIPSMQWFMCYRTPVRDFQAAYSEGAYRAFMENDRISRATKDAVTARMKAYGVDRRGGPGDLAALGSALDARAAESQGDVRLALERDAGASGADGSRPAPATKPGDAGQPDWDQIFRDARGAAAERSSSNDLGIYDGWYRKSYKGWLEKVRGWRVDDGEYFSHEELGDFKLLLRVCRESGVEPLVLIQPVKGALYDQTIYGRDVRATYYEMMRDACAEAGVACADFSSHEYDPLFLREYSHPSDLGGAYYSKAIYRFATEGVVDTAPAGGVAIGTFGD